MVLHLVTLLRAFEFSVRTAQQSKTKNTRTTLLTTISSSSQNFGPKIHQLGGLEGRDKPGLVVNAQLGDLNQTKTKHTLEKAQNIQQ